jgi:hypothetical protein
LEPPQHIVPASPKPKSRAPSNRCDKVEALEAENQALRERLGRG